MGENILTSHQSAVVEFAQTNPEIRNVFYLTGGTALTAFYLYHRLSEDLDFFTESDVNTEKLKNLLSSQPSQLGITAVREVDHHGVVFFYLTFADKEVLKVDFVTFPYRPVEKGMIVHGLMVDSIFDIALNKLYTLSDRPRARDYVDLYTILTSQDISLEQVLGRMNDKFYPFTYDDVISLGIKLSRVVDATEFPQMLIPFDRQKMIDFFLAEAKKLEHKIFK